MGCPPCPHDHRSEATLTGTEREQLEAFLHDNRLEIVGLLDGVTEEQARRRLVPSLAHRPPVAARRRRITDEDTVESVLAGYRQAWAEATEIAAAYALDDLAVHNRRGLLTLRWIYVHMVEELARHAGHGDILKEQILAADAG